MPACFTAGIYSPVVFTLVDPEQLVEDVQVRQPLVSVVVANLLG